jgi:hypothetical protein
VVFATWNNESNPWKVLIYGFGERRYYSDPWSLCGLSLRMVDKTVVNEMFSVSVSHSKILLFLVVD